MVRRSFFLSLILALLLLAACEKQPAHTHSWDAANCLRGELCWSCKETRGEALGHDWVDATCEKAKHCSRCGKSEGNPLFHTSDGNGNCTHCKQVLNVYATLDALTPECSSIIYGGVILRFPFFPRTTSGNRSPRSGVFGKEYWIYDQSGTLVAQGTWPQKVYTAIKVDEGVHDVDYHDTEYIPLSPGTYQVKYSYYIEWESKDDGQRPVYMWDVYLVPKGNLLYSSNILTVR